MAKSVGTDEMAQYEPSHLDLHYFQTFLSWSTKLKRDFSFVTEETMTHYFNQKVDIN